MSRDSWEQLTTLSIHLNQECCHSHLARRNGQVEEEDGDPSEEKEVVEFAELQNEGDMVAQTVENGKDTKDLGKDRK